MPRVSHLYFRTAILFLIAGIGIGLHMSISGVHNVTGAHAHANLLGWVTMALFGGYYALNPAKARSRLAFTQYCVYTVGVVVMIPALYVMLAGNQAVEPVVAISSIIAFLGVILFAVVVFTPERAQDAITAHPAAAE